MNVKVKIIILLAFILINLSSALAQNRYDIMIVNGKIIDGSGNGYFEADVGIKGNMIAEIGDLKEHQALRVINAEGLVVSPGFIDVHTHCDRAILRLPANENYITQGVTTVVGGNCGGSPLDVGGFFQQVVEMKPSTNIAILIGHNTVRREIMGMENRIPTSDEMTSMKELVDKAMQDGAVGMSTGLGYLPGIFSEIEEIIELNKVVSRYNGVYASHIRDQGEGMYKSVEEAIRIGKEGNTSVQVSHLKLSYDKIWGETDFLDKIFRDAIDDGLEVYSDQYPYTASSTSLSAVFPVWSLDGGELTERLKDPQLRERIKTDLFESGRMKSFTGRDMLAAIRISSYKGNPEFEGKNLRQILELRGLEPSNGNGAELAIEIVEHGDASCVFFLMDERDIPVIMNYEYNMIGSDGSVISFGREVPHPRSYGSFTRVLGKYVREDNALSLEKAIYKMTGLPAKAFRMGNRGLLKVGYIADITIFDPDSVSDKATYINPHQYSDGIEFVIVNGVVTIDNGELTGVFGGMPVYGSGAK